jgi:lysophospholipase L1-like esterase
MKLFTFGDSWTEGVGGNRKYEDSTDNPEQKTTIRQNYCWPKHLSELLKCEVVNLGVGAFSNNTIFNSICYQLKNKIITQDDFVVIMWSSSLRDQLPFFTNEDSLHIWGERYKSKQHLIKYIFDGINGNNINYNRAEKDFRDYYITNLFNESYYDIINQNYILHLQFIFKQMGIRYLFCDAFDNMIGKTVISEIDNSNLIDNNRYWGYREKTFADFLIDLKRRDVWEDNNYWSQSTTGKHPSNIGYQLIAEELYKFILNSNLMEPDANKNKNYLI